MEECCLTRRLAVPLHIRVLDLIGENVSVFPKVSVCPATGEFFVLRQRILALPSQVTGSAGTSVILQLCGKCYRWGRSCRITQKMRYFAITGWLKSGSSLALQVLLFSQQQRSYHYR